MLAASFHIVECLPSLVPDPNGPKRERPATSKPTRVTGLSPQVRPVRYAAMQPHMVPNVPHMRSRCLSRLRRLSTRDMNAKYDTSNATRQVDTQATQSKACRSSFISSALSSSLLNFADSSHLSNLNTSDDGQPAIKIQSTSTMVSCCPRTSRQAILHTSPCAGRASLLRGNALALTLDFEL